MLLDDFRSGPASVTVPGAMSPATPLASATVKKLPPDCTSGPAWKVEFVRPMRGSGVVLGKRAASPTKNPLQHGETRPRLDVLKLLATADNSGPASVTLVGAPVELDRRAVKTFPEVSTTA